MILVTRAKRTQPFGFVHLPILLKSWAGEGMTVLAFDAAERGTEPVVRGGDRADRGEALSWINPSRCEGIDESLRS